MGTHCFTKVLDGDTVLVNLYRQMDGFPGGHGRELCDFLRGIRVIDGVGPAGTANGVSCLAAQLVAHFKVGPGGFYLEPVDATRDDAWIADFEYQVRVDAFNQIQVSVHDGNEMLFDGGVLAFYSWLLAELAAERMMT